MTSPNQGRLRGFELVTSYQSRDIQIPSRKTMTSAGYDFAAAEDVVIHPQEIKLVPTGIKAYMQNDEVLKLYARSSIAVNKQLILANGVGVIDQDYYNNESNEGHILLPLFNASNQIVTIQKGERVAQGVFEKFLSSDSESRPASKRSGGFGSTGR
jgi:dUTP pyrophosphatase